MTIKALFIDLGNTLYDSATPVEIAMQRVYELIFEKYQIDVHQLREAYSKVYPEPSADVFSGKTTRDLRTERFAKLLGFFDIIDSEFTTQLEKEYTDLFEVNLKLFDGVLQKLGELSEHYDLFLITDGPDEGQRRILDVLGITEYFTDIFTSGGIGKPKSGGSLFAYSLTQTPYKSDEVVVVGDSPKRDIHAAKKAGLRAILLDRNKVKSRHGAEVVISSFFDLESAIRILEFGAVFVKNSKLSTPLLVLGHPRSGTNFCSHILREHPDVSIAIEPFSMHFGFMVNNDCRIWTADDYDPASMHKSLSVHSEGSRYLKDFRSWFYSQNGELRVLKETLWFLQMRWLKRYLPGVRIIYLERETEGIIASFKKGNFFQRWGYSKRYDDLADEIRKRTELSQYSDIFSSQGMETWVDKLTKIWLVRVSEARKCLSDFEHIALTYSDLCNEPELMFGQILDFAGLCHCDLVYGGINERRNGHRGGSYSTYRDPKKSLNQWKSVLTCEEQQKVKRVSRLLKPLGGVNGIRLAKRNNR